MPNPFRFLLERYHSLNIRPPITAALIAGTFVLLAALVNLLATTVKPNPQAHVVPARPVETPPAQQAKPTDPYEFAQAVIRSLALAADARQRLVATELTGDNFTDGLRAMTDARVAIGKLEHARLEVQDFADSPNEAMALAVHTFDQSYQALISALHESIRTQEKLVSVSSEQELGALMNETSRWAAAAEESWKLLAFAAGAVAHALVDNTRTTRDGKLAYLAITAEQRAGLLKELEAHFGESAKKGMVAGQYATEAAPALLWQFLNEPWLPADTPAS